MDLFIEQRRPREPLSSSDAMAGGVPYSVSHEEYRAELAFDRKRDRLRKVRSALRVLSLVIIVPTLLVAVFTASYALTFILSGASPEEVVEALADCFKMIWENIRSVGVSWGVWPLE